MTRRLRRGAVAIGLLAMTVGWRSLPAAEPQHCFMWRVRSATTSIYVLGSVHVLKPDVDPVGPQVRAAFDRARTLVFEVDMDRLGAAGLKLLAAGTLPEGTRLADVVSPQTYALTRARMDALGLQVDTFARMRPWMLALTLSAFELTRAGYSQDAGVDQRLFALAKDAGKRLLALETVEFQVGLFSGLARAEDEAVLRETLAEMDTLIPQVEELTAAWRRGDVRAVAELLREGYRDYPGLFDRLVTRRNRSWLPHLEGLLAGDEEAMVVVGALHLVGDEGVLELLRRKGYAVEQM